LSGKRVRGLQDSLFYHATYITPPKWVDKKEYVITIGRHSFYNRARIA
jgi:spore germination cell wall hydrolase CwlJ-like protein